MTYSTPEHIEESRFRQAVTDLRTQQGLSQGELARRMASSGWPDFHQTTISRIEKGTRPIRLGEARALARILGTEVGLMIAPTEQSKVLARFWQALADVEKYQETAEQIIEAWEESRAEVRGAIHQLDQTDMTTLLDEGRIAWLMKAREKAEQYAAMELDEIMRKGVERIFRGWPDFFEGDEDGQTD